MPLYPASAIRIMDRNSQLLLQVARDLEPFLTVQRTTLEIDAEAVRLLGSHGLRSALLGFQGYPASICASVNDGIDSCLPSDRQLQEGDTLNLVMAIKVDGYWSKLQRCYGIGDLSAETIRLLGVADDALQAGINKAVAGNRVSDISHAIEAVARTHGCGVVREMGGHSIGMDLHEYPMVPCYGPPGLGLHLRPGMVLQILALLTASEKAGIRVGEDGWSTFTSDGSRAINVGHIVAVDDGPARVLTLPNDHDAWGPTG